LIKTVSKIPGVTSTDNDKNKFMNLASGIAMEEVLTVNVAMDNGTEKERVHQRVLCLQKLPARDDSDSED
jgi:hypothetical protein